MTANHHEGMNKYNNEVNPRDLAMSLLWVRPAARAIAARFPDPRDKRVLDYGCGYFDLGHLMTRSGLAVDGFDINGEALAKARSLYPDCGNLYDEPGSIPDGAYDAIVLNSVLQYFSGPGEVGSLLANCRRWLKPGGQLILTDLIPTGYLAPLDALWSLAYATRHGCFKAMIRHLYAAATNGSAVQLYKIDFPELERIARLAAFNVTRERTNWTPSIFRYSAILV